MFFGTHTGIHIIPTQSIQIKDLRNRILSTNHICRNRAKQEFSQSYGEREERRKGTASSALFRSRGITVWDGLVVRVPRFPVLHDEMKGGLSVGEEFSKS